MSSFPSPEVVVQRQLDAYNAPQMRARMTARFQEPNLHAKLVKRAVMGHFVVDHEDVTRTFPTVTLDG